jgi:hypothetical protein
VRNQARHSEIAGEQLLTEEVTVSETALVAIADLVTIRD